MRRSSAPGPLTLHRSPKMSTPAISRRRTWLEGGCAEETEDSVTPWGTQRACERYRGEKAAAVELRSIHYRERTATSKTVPDDSDVQHVFRETDAYRPSRNSSRIAPQRRRWSGLTPFYCYCYFFVSLALGAESSYLREWAWTPHLNTMLCSQTSISCVILQLSPFRIPFGCDSQCIFPRERVCVYACVYVHSV